MFERFTNAARTAVLEATDTATELGASRVGPQHLLLAIASGDGVGGRVLAGYGVTAANLRAAIARSRRQAGLTQDEVEALRTVGIDADEVFRRVEESFGAEALRPVRPSTRERRGRFEPAAKDVLEKSLREALALKHKYIGTEHILLGLLAQGSVADLLAGTGVTHDDARERVLAELRRAA